MDLEMLINLIQERLVLWDRRNKSYHDRLFTHREWEKVGEVMGTTYDTVKKKWKHLRDTYCRELKKIPKPRSGGDADSEPKYKGTWPYFECMSFLGIIIKPRKTTGNIGQSENLQELSNEESNSTILSESATMDDESQNTGEHNIIVEEIGELESWMSMADDSSSTAETACTQSNDHITLQPGTTISTSGLDTQDCIILQQMPSSSILQQTPSRSMPPKRAAPVTQNRSCKKKRVGEESHEAFLEIEREKINFLRKEQINEDDDDICWFKSLLPFMKQLPALNKLQFRTHMQQILIKELEKMIQLCPPLRLLLQIC
ncbi:uncharacterized protein LOC126735251 [Anthonomus grandis grandis]|uniref:uncharacterized protein LOC126735251 n=1 Tax=Anthonomus grandis grandis TaxID=2921223 RepID=UPI0021662F41|nr:uncharacterized protein LOC126735251 [Anthonomus grandis grandis]